MFVENVRPFSPMQQEILKIYEDGVLNSDIEIDDEYLKISKTAQPSSSDLKRYKLWLEQKYKSPYTGQIIPLNKLFTPNMKLNILFRKADILMTVLVIKLFVNRQLIN
jgi:CRISPR-associated endonuclease Csn1